MFLIAIRNFLMETVFKSIFSSDMVSSRSFSGEPNPPRVGLRCDQEPSQAQISEYASFLQRIEWDEEEAKLGMQEELLGDR